MRVLILLALTGAAVAVPRDEQRIYYSPTTVQEYPYMANIQYCSSPGYYCAQACGGTLITSTAVMSGAWNFYGSNGQVSLPNWRVVLGSSYARNGSTHEISRVIIHEDYNNLYITNDAAIVKLARPAIFSDTIAVAKIAGPNYNLPDGTVLTAIAWGYLPSGGPPYEQLHHVHVNQVNQELCAAQYEYIQTQPGYQNWPNITDGMLCTGIPDLDERDACRGTAGGPVAHSKDIILGITSWATGCAFPDSPGVNTRVSRYADWFVRNAQ